MKQLLLVITLGTALLTGCSREVVFAWSNVSGREITVDNVTGLPAWASPGVLVSNSNDSPQKESHAVNPETLRIANQIRISWTEDGKKQEFEFQRADVGVPATLRRGRLCFTYLGDGKWRVGTRERGS